MLWGQGARVIEVGITFATAVIVLRGLHPSGFGTYSLLTNLAGAASVFVPVVTTESLGAVLPRLATRNERVFTTLLVGAIRAGVIVLATIVAFAVWSRLSSLIGLGGVPRFLALLAGAYWISQDLLNTLVGYYGAEIDMRPVAIWRTAGLTATLVAVVVLAATNEFTEGRVLAVVASGYAIAAAGLLTGLRRVGRPQRPPAEELRHTFGLTRDIWLIGILSFTLATQIDILLIGALTNDRREAAFYAAAVGVVWRVQLLLVSGWAALIIPTFGHAFATGGIERLRRAWRHSSQLWLLVSLPLNALLLANARDVIGLLGGSLYLPATRLLQWVCAFNLAVTVLVNPTSVGALWAADRQRPLARFRIASAGLNIGLAFALIPPYGALGAVIATGVAAVTGGLIEFVLSQRLGANDYPVRLGVVTLLAAGVSTIPGFVIGPDDAAQLLLSIGLGILGYLGVLAVLKPLSHVDVDAAAGMHPRLGGPGLRLFARN
jgi:O-antigen/teichoic acid export membrane protein